MVTNIWKNAAGLQLHSVNWHIENPRAVIALVHGQGEHIERYDHMARWYNVHGVAVLGYDHQGYGQSEGKRGHAKNLDALLDDVELLLEKTRQQYPNVPLFLYGHSMGGHLVLNYTLRRKPQLAGLIATGPWVRLAFEAPFIKVAVGRLLKSIFPALALPTELDANHLSHDTAVVKAYQNDPLVHSTLSAAAGIDLIDGALWLNNYSGTAPVPLLLMHGGDDRLTSAPATRELAGRLSGDVTHHEWPGLYHEIHNEQDKEEVFAYTLRWLESKI